MVSDRIEMIKERCEIGVFLDGLDDALIGSTWNGLPVYSYTRTMKYFTKEFGNEEDAVEWIDFNIMSMERHDMFLMVFDWPEEETDITEEPGK